MFTDETSLEIKSFQFFMLNRDMIGKRISILVDVMTQRTLVLLVRSGSVDILEVQSESWSGENDLVAKETQCSVVHSGRVLVYHLRHVI